MQTLVLRQILKDRVLLQEYLAGNDPDADRIRRRAFVAERAINSRLPDHVFRNWRDRELKGCDAVWPMLRKTLDTYVSYYVSPRGHRIFIDFDRFGEWQNELASTSPLSILAFALFKLFPAPEPHSQSMQEYSNCYLKQFRNTCLIAPFSQPIQDLIEREGLSDLHIHLNGSTEVDVLWQDALRDIEEQRQSLAKAWGTNGEVSPSTGTNEEMLTELYEQIDPSLGPESVGLRLLIARRLREVMAARVMERIPAEELPSFNEMFHDNPIPWDTRFDKSIHPLAKLLGIETLGGRLMDELLLLVLVYQRLDRNKGDVNLAKALHIYLLIINSTYVPLCVQMSEQFGFDQFQKFTLTDAREVSESGYTRRFHQLSNGPPGDLAFLEGRFSPPNSDGELRKLLDSILTGYNRFLSSQRGPSPYDDDPVDFSKGEVSQRNTPPYPRMELRLVAHFVKKRDKKDGACRHSSLREQLSTKWSILRKSHDTDPLVRSYVTGLDAAANEIQTPPEVFAPVFRAAGRAGMVNLTYHVGEDFEHLLTGIRAVYEAVVFLNLRDGNRVGHATAVGIAPEFWLERVPSKLALKIGEVLDNLVFAHHLLIGVPEGMNLIGRLQEEIHRLSDRIYGEPISPQSLWAAWKLRRLDPRYIPDLEENRRIGMVDQVAEFVELHKAREESPHTFRYFEMYHSQSVRDKYELIEHFQSDLVPGAILRRLQDLVLEKLIRRHVVIETLPSSNVRISFYDDFSQHHILRWLGIRDSASGVTPRVCIGSDDPGIFACNIRGEYTHVFREILQVVGCEQIAMRHINAIHEAGRMYRFAISY